MKLKKIASLALAGVMAVSMLAGCKGTESTDTNKDDAQGTVTATSVVSTVEKIVKAYNPDVTITYKDDAAINSAISKLFSEHTYNELTATSNTLINTELGKFFDVSGSNVVTSMSGVSFVDPDAGDLSNKPMKQTKIIVVDSDAAYGSALVLAANSFADQIKDFTNDGHTYTTANDVTIDATANYTVHAYTAEKAETDGTAHTFTIIVMEVEYKI